MVSVVMATYNGECYLQEQLLSICNQTHKPDEIIICDDNSSDKTSEIVKSISDKVEIPMHYFQNAERIGYAQNFKRALALARGDIIFFSDQDDIWEKEKIEMYISFFDKYKNAMALSTSYRLIDGNGKCKRENIFYSFHSLKKIRKIKWKTFIKHPKYPGMAMAVRRELIERVILTDDSREIPHDWLFNEAASYHDEMYFWNIKLTRYRIHENNTVGIAANRGDKQDIDKRAVLINDMEKSLKAVLAFREDKKQYLQKAIFFQRKRGQLYAANKTIRLFLYDFFHLSYISLRSMMGDFYMSVKRRM